MGAFTSRNNAGVEEVDIASNNAYRYPPKMGNYFGTYFIMGGERFDMSQPEAYLFGENTDLNFLGNKPIPFPYPPPIGNEPTKTLKSLVNIRKDSLRFVKIEDGGEMAPVDDSSKEQMNSRYNLEFTFDSDVKCAITVYYFATEDISNGQIVYHPKDKTMNSETFHYKRGTNQLFSQASHIIEPGKFEDDEWQYLPSKDIVPIVIQCNVEEDEHVVHSHITFACVDKSSVDGSYMVKPLKQKQFVDGLPYLLQEIYGIENKQTDQSKIDPDDEVEDSGAECVICMSDMRDTLILPCRHLCLCSTCAESLRYQASNCPICRSPFRALLQIRAMRRKQPIPIQQQGETGEDNPVSQEGVPNGYEAVPLIEALNGPCNQLFSVSEGFLPPMRLPPIETDTHHREKKRSSKSKDQNVNQNVMLKFDDKKMLEEEERKTQMLPEVVMTTETSTELVPGKSPKKKDLPKVVYPDQKDSTDDSKTSDSREDCHLPTNLKCEVLKVYDLNESEADSDYELKPIQINNTTRLSMEDLADDEREDTSEGEPEPEPDYDDEEAPNTEETDDVQSAGSFRSSSQPDIMIEDQATYIQGFSRSAGDINVQDGHGYQMLQAGNVSLPGSAQGSTSLEASSYSSTTSSRGLLQHGGNITDEDKE